jgi:hypothetical protein
MSLWKDYIKEKYNKDMLENDDGFVTYLIYTPNKELYIEDMYVRPDKRTAGTFTSFMKLLEPICFANGCDKLSCYVHLSANKPEDSIKWILKMGFKVSHATADNKIFFVMKVEDYKYE